jgi:hypothetical protein
MEKSGTGGNIPNSVEYLTFLEVSKMSYIGIGYSNEPLKHEAEHDRPL